MRAWRIVSVFDGMACGALALQAAGIEIESYDAFEIDKYAVQTSSHNFPFIKHHGDVFKADFTQFEGVDLVCGGSPCTYWSIAQKNNRETEASGMGWELFQQYVRAVKEAKPKFFIYENNKSMSKAIRQSIDEAFGFEAVLINSALVSAQNRQRLYWVGRRNPDGTYSKVNVEQPIDRGILLKDVLDDNCFVDREKAHCLKHQAGNARDYFKKHHTQIKFEPVAINTTDEGVKARTLMAGYYKYGTATLITNEGFKGGTTAVAEPVRIGGLPRPNGELSTSQAMRLYSVDGKSVNLTSNGGGLGAKTGLYAIPVCHTIPQEVRVRKFTCDIEEFQKLLRESKKKSKLTNKNIAEKLGRPQTEVEHWFRTDKCFNIPDEDIWFDLKKLLNIETAEYDDFVTVFEMREGVFEKANRCYDVNGKMSTIMTGKTDSIIEPLYYAIPCEWDEEGKPVKAVSRADGKTYRVHEVRNGQITIKGKQYPIKLADGFYIIRKLTVSECKRLQTVPEWYEFPVSDSQAYKMLGNGWTVEVIAHLINSCLSDNGEHQPKNGEQIRLF